MPLTDLEPAETLRRARLKSDPFQAKKSANFVPIRGFGIRITAFAAGGLR